MHEGWETDGVVCGSVSFSCAGVFFLGKRGHFTYQLGGVILLEEIQGCGSIGVALAGRGVEVGGASGTQSLAV